MTSRHDVKYKLPAASHAFPSYIPPLNPHSKHHLARNFSTTAILASSDQAHAAAIHPFLHDPSIPGTSSSPFRFHFASSIPTFARFLARALACTIHIVTRRYHTKPCQLPIFLQASPRLPPGRTRIEVDGAVLEASGKFDILLFCGDANFACSFALPVCSLICAFATTGDPATLLDTSSSSPCHTVISSTELNSPSCFPNFNHSLSLPPF